MRAGNKEYKSIEDISDVIPVFPLSGALLLPGGNLPLNIFEPRYLAMFEEAFSSDKLIGMIQPALSGAVCDEGPELCEVGCVGRLTGIQESGDGRFIINLSGICRFTLVEEVVGKSGYRRAKIMANASDFNTDNEKIDREALIVTFKRYLETNNMEADWTSIEATEDKDLVTALCMMCPYGTAEKQALLEANDLKTRADTLVALTEIELAKNSDDAGSSIQ